MRIVTQPYVVIESAVLYALQPRGLTFEFNLPMKKLQASFELGGMQVDAELGKLQLDMRVAPPVTHELDASFKKMLIEFTLASEVTTGDNTWVVNLKTGGHSRYTHYDFDFFFTLNGKQYAGNQEGVFLLEGNTDFLDNEGNPTQLIESEVVTGASDLGIKFVKQVSDVYVYGRVAGDLELTSVIDEETYVAGLTAAYEVTGTHRMRIKHPRGVKGNAWQFKLKNVDGCDFAIQEMNMTPVPTKRTVRG